MLKIALLRNKCKMLAIDAAPLVFIPGDAKKIELFLGFTRGM